MKCGGKGCDNYMTSNFDEVVLDGEVLRIWYFFCVACNRTVYFD